MPFTAVHPAAAVIIQKICRHRFIWAGLVAGSMAPDFEYFLRLRLLGLYGHTSIGVWLFSLPIAWCLAWLYLQIIDPVLRQVLPLAISQRMLEVHPQSWWQRSCERPLWMLVSIMVGVYSHVLWDGFTHASGFFVQYSIGLQQYIIGEWTGFRLLQHGSNILAFLFLINCFWQQVPKHGFDAGVNLKIKCQFWLVYMVLSSLLFGFFHILQPSLSGIGHQVVMALASLMYAMLICSIIFKCYQHSNQ